MRIRFSIKTMILMLFAFAVPGRSLAQENAEGKDAMQTLIDSCLSGAEKTTVLDVTDLRAEYVDPIQARKYFPTYSTRTDYKALAAFPLGGNDYIRTRATDAQIDSADFFFFTKLRMRRNGEGERPYVGSFTIDDAGRLRVAFENVDSNKVLFQMKIKKHPDEAMPTHYHYDLTQETTPFVNALALTPDRRLLVLKGAGREFYEVLNRISRGGYVFRMDAGLNARSFSSDPQLAEQPGWGGVQGHSGQLGDYFNNIQETAGVVFYDRDE